MVFVISGIVACLLVLVIIQLLLSQKKRKETLGDVLKLLFILKRIIGLSQKHRGLNATYLQGNQAVSSEIHQVRDDIGKLIHKASQIGQTASEARWVAYLDHWHRLEPASMQLTPPESFKQHTSLIETLLYLLQDVAEHIEFADTEHSLTSVHFLWREFPQLVEFIGQARAVGVATATKGQSTQIDKVKLGYLCEKINLMSESVFNKLNKATQVSKRDQLNQAKNACTQLTSLINQQLIKPDIVSIKSQDYFATASQTMEVCNTLFDTELTAVLNNMH